MLNRQREVSEREAKRDSRGVTPRPRPVEERKKISRGRRRPDPFHLVTMKWLDIVTLQKSSRVTIDGNLHFPRVSERSVTRITISSKIIDETWML